jgi:Tripartite tricarboxylate transporter TctB family
MAAETARDHSVPPSPHGMQDVAAGLFLVFVAAIGLWQASSLPMGTLRAVGPGLLPMSLSVMLGALGVAIAGMGYLKPGQALERWSLRGLLFVLGSIILFALTIRTLGLIVAGPLTMLVAGAADPQTNWKHTLIFSIILTGFCILLFKVALRLPIPVIAFM